MHEIATASVAAAIFLAAPGCAGPSPSGASASDASPSRPPPSPTEPTLLSIGGFVHRSDGSLLSGVNVCLYRGFTFATDSAGPARVILPDPAACADSAADGAFRVSGAQASDRVVLTFRRDGFAPTLRAIEMQTDDVALPENENALMPAPLVFMGTPADRSKGQVSFSVMAGALDYQLPLLSPVSVTATAFGLLTGFDGPPEPPRYAPTRLGRGEPGLPSSSLDGVEEAGALVGTTGGLVNVPSGLYVLQFGSASAPCAASSGVYGYPASGFQEAAILVPVLEGYVTAPVGMACPIAP